MISVLRTLSRLSGVISVIRALSRLSGVISVLRALSKMSMTKERSIYTEDLASS